MRQDESWKTGEVDAVEAVVLALGALSAGVGVVGLVAAYVGVHSLAVVLSALLMVAGACAVMMIRRGVRGRIVTPHRSALWLIVSVAVAAVLSFPGFHYAAGDRDPGIYVLHAISIARTGELDIPMSSIEQADVLTERVPGGMPFGGFERNGDGWRPSFYHLWPSLLAVAFEAVGFGALAVVLPLLALLAVALAYCLGRRLGGPTVGVLASLVLGSNMMQVWQAKYPTTEMYAQVIVLSAALAATLAARRDSRWAALLAGVLVTTGFLVRGEGVVLLLAANAIAALGFAAGRRPHLAAWFAGGTVPLLPLALLQAYFVAEEYSRKNDVPGLTLVLVALAAELTFALVGRRWVSRRGRDAMVGQIDARLPHGPRSIRWAVTTVVIGVFAFGVVRPLLGHETFDYNGRLIRSYDEQSLHRLAWFFSWPGLGLALLGILGVVWRRLDLSRLLVMSLGMAFFVLFLARARNSPYLMWWGRRFVPIVVPFLALAIALSVPALSRAFARRSRHVVSAAVAGVVLVVGFQVTQSWGLRGHDEMAGSYSIAEQVASVAEPGTAVLLWERGPCCGSPGLMFGASTWLIGEQSSGYLPEDPAEFESYVSRVAGAAQAEQQVFVIADATSSIGPTPSFLLEAVRQFDGVVVIWEENSETRPSTVVPRPFSFVVYRVVPVGSAG